MGTGGRPLWYHTAVAEATSTARAPSPYQSATVMAVQAVAGSARRAASVGRRWPFTRGRPRWPGERGAAGSYKAASERRRVMIVTGRARRAQRASSAITA